MEERNSSMKHADQRDFHFASAYPARELTIRFKTTTPAVRIQEFSSAFGKSAVSMIVL